MSSPALDWTSVTAEAVGLLKQLIRIDTTNPQGNERAATDSLARVLTRENIPFQVVESLPGRSSIVARIRGTGAKPPLLLNGHLDVVAADRERWRHDPFSG